LTSDDDGQPPGQQSGERPDRIHEHVSSLLRHKTMARAIGSVVVLGLLAVAGVAIARQGGPAKPVSGSLISSGSPSPKDSAAGSPSATPTPTDAPWSPGEISDPPTATQSPLVCLNSVDPACGSLYWDPFPGQNASLMVNFTASADVVDPGQQVIFRLSTSDEDAKIACRGIYFGDEGAPWMFPQSSMHRYGRWETPAKERGELADSWTHTYAEPGTYVSRVFVDSGVCGDPEATPYGARVFAETTITVAGPAPSTTAT